ncbi:MAG: hypothetical protein IKK20_04205 [Clostridia bacterium]|nr:hypothetical protein [Clostridia bacterium]MBR3790984.1 hypothetical protein [Clostridia bacterium]
MIITKTYKDEQGVEHINLVETTTDDESKLLLQVETGKTYDKAIDVVPIRFTYQEIDKNPDNVVEMPLNEGAESHEED